MSKTGTYARDPETGKYIKVSEKARTPFRGTNGPVWFPKGGYKYFDRALQRTFHSKQEKVDFMKQHKLVMDGSDKHKLSKGPEAGLGRTVYNFPKGGTQDG